MDRTPYIGKAIFYFFAAVPYKLFQIGYFLFSFPKRLRHLRRYKNAPKEILFRRIAGKHTVLSAVEAVYALRGASGQIRNRPSMFSLLEDLWSEGMDEAWKLPMVSELEVIRSALCADIERIPFAEQSGARVLLWAIDDHSHMFVLFDPRTGNVSESHPRNMVTVFRGMPPDSCEVHTAYAVSVRPTYVE